MTTRGSERPWAHRTSAEHADLAGTATLVLPIGATEQHGPHLPVGVDALVAEHIARAAAARVSCARHPVVVAPILSYGSSHHHLPRPGTLSVSSTTLAAVLVDILSSAAVTGYRRMFVLNGHGGNEDIARQAIRDVALTYDVVTACSGYWSLAWEDVVATAARYGVAPVPGHAGSFETSIVLSLWPELVAEPPRSSRRHPESSRHPLSAVVVEEHRWVERIGWYTDDPSSASATAGREILKVLVDGCEAWLSRFVTDASIPPSETEGS